MKTQVWIVDFGSQYTQLITRKTRELGYSCQILTVEEAKKKFLDGVSKNFCKALILSGGPDSVYEDKEDYSFLFQDKGLPILGICYGMQIMCFHFGGHVQKGKIGEYGHQQVTLKSAFQLRDVPSEFSVWMSHGDHVSQLPSTPKFESIIQSHNGLIAGIKVQSRPWMGLQFHPEVQHTQYGKEILSYFLQDMAQLQEDWTNEEMLNNALQEVRNAGKNPVLCAFSGGVDSLVAATLAHRVLGNDLYCFFIDHGLLRPQDYIHIRELKEKTPLNIEILECKDLFLNKLQGVKDPEEKRKIIGKTFIEVFEQKVHEFEHQHQIHFEYLLQGTLYPDVIESISPHGKKGKSVTIKSHHNVGGLPERMRLKLLEPLKFLFKDEVRALGKKLELPREWVYRHPFPGPGIGIRILGEVKADSIRKVQESDQILLEELKNFQLYDAIWQSFTVLLPVKTVGVKGDARAYEEVICLRLVNSSDGMTAHWSDVPFAFLNKVSSRITNEVPGITRVVYDITSKPPSTIEWE